MRNDPGTRTFITRAGKRIAAVVPVNEADILEAAEDAYLNRLADQAEAAQGVGPRKTLAEVLAEYAEDFGEELVRPSSSTGSSSAGHRRSFGHSKL